MYKRQIIFHPVESVTGGFDISACASTPLAVCLFIRPHYYARTRVCVAGPGRCGIGAKSVITPLKFNAFVGQSSVTLRVNTVITACFAMAGIKLNVRPRHCFIIVIIFSSLLILLLLFV